jgi:hypothetical protein
MFVGYFLRDYLCSGQLAAARRVKAVVEVRKALEAAQEFAKQHENGPNKIKTNGHLDVLLPLTGSKLAALRLRRKLDNFEQFRVECS